MNVYADQRRAESYAKLEFPGTYYLAYRDLPEIFRAHVRGSAALDFGCGAGRSTRFLRQLGFQVVGVDISAAMIAMARRLDAEGDYVLVPDGDLSALPRDHFDLALAAFTFDNIPNEPHRIGLLGALRERLDASGTLVLIDSTPELYLNEWASFSTAASCPENRTAESGDIVRTVMLDVDDRRPVEDVLWLDEDYRRAFSHAGLKLVARHLPLGKQEEPFRWVTETRLAPWVIYVLQR
jgi:SAM-dependent methyltransferase